MSAAYTLASWLAPATTVLLLAGAPARVGAQQSGMAPLVFDAVTVVDVEHGKLLPNQRVVIVGSRIQTMGDVGAVPLPPKAEVVAGRGKYLIPGLWDMHVHGQLAADPAGYPAPFTAYSVLLTNGITGIRDAGTGIPLDTLIAWRREILAGKRVGPPRQIFSGQAVSNEIPDCERARQARQFQTCVLDDPADQRHFVDSIKTAGIDMIKLREINDAAVYFRMAQEAKRIGLPVGGQASEMTAIEASDSGATIVDHLDQYVEPSLLSLCDPSRLSASAAQCAPVAERFKRNGTWLIPTLFAKVNTERGQALGGQERARAIIDYLDQHRLPFDSLRRGGWLRAVARPGADSSGSMYILQRVGMPMLAGTDIRYLPLGQGELHVELAILVAEGMTPLAALQSATLNPARMWHATDSLGSVAPGKLADLVLLDGDPLDDITNTATIRAVVANGRYYDRGALDKLAAETRSKAQGEPWPPSD